MFHLLDLHLIHIQIVDQHTVVLVKELPLLLPVLAHLIDQMQKVFLLQLVMIVEVVIKRIIYPLENLKMMFYYVKNLSIVE